MLSCSFQERFLPEVESKFGHRSVMLASAKEGLYHPRLPTFRRMDRDTVAQKLPYDHCRTTTILTKGRGKEGGREEGVDNTCRPMDRLRVLL